MAATRELVASGMKVAGIGGGALTGTLPLVGGGLALASVGPRFIGKVDEGYVALKRHHGRLRALKDERKYIFGRVAAGETYGFAEPGWVLALPAVDRWDLLSTQDKTTPLTTLKVSDKNKQLYELEPQLTFGIKRPRDSKGNLIPTIDVEEENDEGIFVPKTISYPELAYRGLIRAQNAEELVQGTASMSSEALRHIVVQQTLEQETPLHLEGDVLLPMLKARIGKRVLGRYAVELRGLSFTNISEYNVHTLRWESLAEAPAIPGLFAVDEAIS